MSIFCSRRQLFSQQHHIQRFEAIILGRTINDVYYITVGKAALFEQWPSLEDSTSAILKTKARACVVTGRIRPSEVP
jgi:hypothetical protein